MHLKEKWLTYSEAKVLVNRLKQANVQTCGFFIIGYPGETIDDVKVTLAYANALPLEQRNIYFATPYKGTKLYSDCERNGWLVNSTAQSATYRDAVINTPWLKRDELLKLWSDDREAALRRVK
jgi:radical SAM superfamily enzyme YgiQ (UPF0313 family)